MCYSCSLINTFFSIGNIIRLKHYTAAISFCMVFLHFCDVKLLITNKPSRSSLISAVPPPPPDAGSGLQGATIAWQLAKFTHTHTHLYTHTVVYHTHTVTLYRTFKNGLSAQRPGSPLKLLTLCREISCSKSQPHI